MRLYIIQIKNRWVRRAVILTTFVPVLAFNLVLFTLAAICQTVDNALEVWRHPVVLRDYP